MVPVNISCHAAVTGSSLTHVPVRKRYGLTQLHSLSALLCTPTLMPSPPCLHVSSACPHRETLCALAAEGRPTEYSQHLASRGSLIKVNHEHGTPRAFSKISVAWGRKHSGRSTVVSCRQGLAECDPGNRWGPAMQRGSLPARLDRLIAHPPG